MPTVVILSERNHSPFHLYLIGLVAIAGLGIMLGISNNPIHESMGQYSIAWGAFLLIGGILNLLGIYWPKSAFTGMLIERSGLVALGGASLIWSILVVWRVQLAGLFSATLTFALFLACLAQWRWVNKNVSKIIKAVDE
jgi:hypothetical protein